MLRKRIGRQFKPSVLWLTAFDVGPEEASSTGTPHSPQWIGGDFVFTTRLTEEARARDGVLLDPAALGFEERPMRKTLISKRALAGVIDECLKAFPECPPGMSFEIRPFVTSDGPSWTAITSLEDSLSHLNCAQIVGALTIELRKIYELSDE